MDGDVRNHDVRSTGATFACLVLQWRRAAHLTQEELAAKTGLSSRTIQNIERGTVNRPRRESVRLIANALDLSDSARAEFEQAARTGASNRQTGLPADEELRRFSVRQLLRELERRFGRAGPRSS